MIIVQPWTCTCRFSFSSRISTHLGPFMVVLGGMNYRPAAPCHDMVHLIIWLGGCFIVGTTYFLSKRLPNGRVMCMWRGIHTNLHFSQSSRFSLITGVRCGFRAGLRDFSPNCMPKRLERVVELIVVPFKRLIARIFLQELFGESITICLIEGTSMTLVFHGQPELCMS